jgi:cytochrome P450/NADPH-cytochrome P450 reductase
MEIVSGDHRAKALRQDDTALGRVISNKVLTREGTPEKRHIGELSR